MKHRIVGGYVKAALNTLMQWSKRDVMYGDLFAGAGRYEDGQPGSPLIVAEEARACFERGKPPYIHCFNVERDQKTFAKLEAATAHIPGSVITNKLGDWRDHIGELLGRAQAGSMPTLLFLDPFGFKGIELTNLVEILQGIGSDAREMILTLNLAGMQRMVAAGRADDLRGKKHVYYELPDLVFGTPNWRQHLEDGLMPDAAIPKVLALYQEQLLTIGGSGFRRIVAPIGIPLELSGPDAYFLLFVTRSGKGLFKMSDTANLEFEKAWHELEQREKAERQTRAQLEFDLALSPTYADRQTAFLPTLAADAEREVERAPFGMTIADLHVRLALRHFGLFRRRHLGDIVRALRAEDAVEMNPPTRVEDDTFIKWKGRAQASAG